MFLSDITADTALSLDGSGRLDYGLSQSRKRDVLLARALRDPGRPVQEYSSLELKFRTRSGSGTLLHAQESYNYTTVRVRVCAAPAPGSRPAELARPRLSLQLSDVTSCTNSEAAESYYSKTHKHKDTNTFTVYHSTVSHISDLARRIFHFQIL